MAEEAPPARDDLGDEWADESAAALREAGFKSMLLRSSRLISVCYPCFASLISLSMSLSSNSLLLSRFCLFCCTLLNLTQKQRFGLLFCFSLSPSLLLSSSTPRIHPPTVVASAFQYVYLFYPLLCRFPAFPSPATSLTKRNFESPFAIACIRSIALST